MISDQPYIILHPHHQFNLHPMILIQKNFIYQLIKHYN